LRVLYFLIDVGNKKCLLSHSPLQLVMHDKMNAAVAILPVIFFKRSQFQTLKESFYLYFELIPVTCNVYGARISHYKE